MYLSRAVEDWGQAGRHRPAPPQPLGRCGRGRVTAKGFLGLACGGTSTPTPTPGAGASVPVRGRVGLGDRGSGGDVRLSRAGGMGGVAQQSSDRAAGRALRSRHAGSAGFHWGPRCPTVSAWRGIPWMSMMKSQALVCLVCGRDPLPPVSVSAVREVRGGGRRGDREGGGSGGGFPPAPIGDTDVAVGGQ